MLNLRHLNGLVDHQDQVAPCVLPCIQDSSSINLSLLRQLGGVKTLTSFGMLVNYKGISAHYSSVSI